MKKSLLYSGMLMLCFCLMTGCGQMAQVQEETVAETIETESETVESMQMETEATLSIRLDDGGKVRKVETEAKTVKEFLEAEGITLGEEDSLEPESQDTEITEGMRIIITRIQTKEEKKTESVDFETEKQYTDQLAQGVTQTGTAGEKGEKTITYKVVYTNGKETSREVVEEKVTKKPVKEIIYVGTYVEPVYEEPVYVEPEVAVPAPEPPARVIVSQENVPDCDGSGSGTTVITYSDGTQDFIRY